MQWIADLTDLLRRLPTRRKIVNTSVEHVCHVSLPAMLLVDLHFR